MPRVAGVDPGTLTFDLCVLDDGAVVVERAFESGSLAEDPAPLLEALAAYGPYDLVYGPSGYGLPLVRASEVGPGELAEMVLVRPDEAGIQTGVGGMRRLLRALIDSGLPVVFGPGVIHLPSVPGYRKWNRIDMGTADKVCAAACAIADQASRHAIGACETRLILVEVGGAFTAALAIAAGEIVDGLGGSSGPIGFRAAGALDGELAYLLGPALTKRTLFSGGTGDEGRTALVEAVAKAVRALLVSVPDPREVVLSGRHAGLVAGALDDVAPVVTLRADAAARGGALLADGLAGGANAPLVEAMRLREAAGSALDHLRVAGASAIRLG
jgi:predicted butyrate kinase (DUF1464 family)